MQMSQREYKDINTISKEVKLNLHNAFPGTKWSVRTEKYAGGRSLHVSLMEAPFEVFDTSRPPNIVGRFAGSATSDIYRYTDSSKQRGYAQLNEYQLRDKSNMNPRVNNGVILTPEAISVMMKAENIINRDNWDNSDAQTDYFDVNYYVHLNVGQYDKPFKVVQSAMPKTRIVTRTASSKPGKKKPAKYSTGVGRTY
jgi:hypothetical protein